MSFESQNNNKGSWVRRDYSLFCNQLKLVVMSSESFEVNSYLFCFAQIYDLI
jgi:hypothetical protein